MNGIRWSVLQKIQISTRKIFFIFYAKRRKSVEKKERKIERKIGVTERSRSLNPRKVIAMAIFLIIVHFTT